MKFQNISQSPIILDEKYVVLNYIKFFYFSLKRKRLISPFSEYDIKHWPYKG